MKHLRATPGWDPSGPTPGPTGVIYRVTVAFEDTTCARATEHGRRPRVARAPEREKPPTSKVIFDRICRAGVR